MSADAFVGGLLNPLTTPAHLIALLGLGLLIGGGRSGSRLAPLAAFALGLGGGLAAIALGVGQTPALDVLLIATALIGLLVALAPAIPTMMSALLALIVGAALGLDSPPQAISIADATATLIGTGLAAGVVPLVVVACVTLITRAWQRIGLRIVGSWIAASAILVLALRFARGMLFGG